MKDITLAPGESLMIEVLDTADAPAQAFRGRRLIWWYPVAGAVQYRIDEYVGSTWVQRALVQTMGIGFFSWKTRFLEDSTAHQFRVVPIGSNRNDGTPLLISEFMVRHPDPPEQDFSYDDETFVVTVNA
jgi:hypothetical protein